MLAGIFDRVSLLLYAQTKDAKKNRNRKFNCNQTYICYVSGNYGSVNCRKSRRADKTSYSPFNRFMRGKPGHKLMISEKVSEKISEYVAPPCRKYDQPYKEGPRGVIYP